MLITYNKADLAKQLNVTFEEGERILWSGRPRLKVFLLNSVLSLFYALLWFLGIFAVFWFISYALKGELNYEGMFVFLLLIVVTQTGSTIWEMLRLRKTIYVITDISVIICSGFRSSSTTNIYVNDIQNKQLKQTFIDRRFGTGAISLFTGQMKENDGKMEKVYDVLCAITDPGIVYRLV